MPQMGGIEMMKVVTDSITKQRGELKEYANTIFVLSTAQGESGAHSPQLDSGFQYFCKLSILNSWNSG
jgi:hypothetical protein